MNHFFLTDCVDILHTYVSVGILDTYVGENLILCWFWQFDDDHGGEEVSPQLLLLRESGLKSLVMIKVLMLMEVAQSWHGNDLVIMMFYCKRTGWIETRK